MCLVLSVCTGSEQFWDVVDPGRLRRRDAGTGPADITLKVKPPKGAAATVAKAKGKGKTGINRISWNRKLKGRKAGKGSYRLTITATAGGKTVSSTLAVKS